MATHISNKTKVHEVECSEGLRFEPPMHLITSIATSMSSSERAHSLLIQILRPGERYFLYNPIELAESYINMLTSHDSLLAKKWYLTCATLKESEILSARNLIPTRKRSSRMVGHRFRNSINRQSSSSKVLCLVLRTCLYLSLSRSDYKCLATFQTRWLSNGM